MTQPSATPTTEEWRPIVGYDGLYEVSSHGRVRSVDRWVETPNRWGGITRYHKPGRVLAQKRKKQRLHAYAVVNLSSGGVVGTSAVHRLVLEAFVGPCPDGMETRHRDGNLFDNRLSNLKWGTPSENARDRVTHGTHHQASQTHCPYGHELAAPNLDPTQEARGYRRCFACALTQMWGRRLDLRPGDSDWVVEAHRRHAEILHFGRAINYRFKVNRGTLADPRPRWVPGDCGSWQLD